MAEEFEDDGLSGRLGDPDAGIEYKLRLEASVRRIVRRVIRFGRASSRFDRCILSEVERMMPSAANRREVDNEALTLKVSHRLCEMILTRISGAKLGAMETRATFVQNGFSTVSLAHK